MLSNKRSMLINGNFISGLVLAALGSYIFTQALNWDYMTIEGPGPGFFPYWYGLAMVFLSLLLVASAILEARTSENPKTVNWPEVGRALSAWLLFSLSVFLMKYLGFLIVLSALTWFVIKFMYQQNQKIAITTAVGISVGFYFIFAYALQLNLPVGPLGL